MKHSVKFDDYLNEKLKDKIYAREFLNASLESYIEDGNVDEFVRSLELVIKANWSVSDFAKETNLNRSNLYSIFRHKNKPQFDTILKIFAKLGFSLRVA